MSDEEHHFESKGDAGASKTYPQQAGTIRKNGYIVIKSRPCKVYSRSDLLFLDPSFFLILLVSWQNLFSILFFECYFWGSVCFFRLLGFYYYTALRIYLDPSLCNFSINPGIYSVEVAVFRGLILLDLSWDCGFYWFSVVNVSFPVLGLPFFVFVFVLWVLILKFLLWCEIYVYDFGFFLNVFSYGSRTFAILIAKWKFLFWFKMENY